MTRKNIRFYYFSKWSHLCENSTCVICLFTFWLHPVWTSHVHSFVFPTQKWLPMHTGLFNRYTKDLQLTQSVQDIRARFRLPAYQSSAHYRFSASFSKFAHWQGDTTRAAWALIRSSQSVNWFSCEMQWALLFWVEIWQGSKYSGPMAPGQ